jgi:hypothetical protein
MNLEKTAGGIALFSGLMTYIALLGVVEDIAVPVSRTHAATFWVCFTATVTFSVVYLFLQLENRK